MKAPICPQCGCTAKYVQKLAHVTCELYSDGTIGKTLWVGRRLGEAVYLCGGAHKFDKNGRSLERPKSKGTKA